MRADRLVSILMLLQARGPITAQALADELEVSVRTVYRDIDALSYSGVPVYTERGPGGGVSLLDSYRTTLTGMTRDEMRALFMLQVPTPLSDLGLDQDLRAALRKLAAVLPASRRGDEERVRQRVHLDPTGWSASHRPLPHLETIYRALWQDRLVLIRYQLPFQTEADRRIAPLGLVAKGREWYLVCIGEPVTRSEPEAVDRVRVLPVSRALAVELSQESFQRPSGFDLPAFWRSWCEAYEANRPRFEVTLRVSPRLQPFMAQVFGEQASAGPLDTGDGVQAGWITLHVEFESLDEARRRILGLGGAAEVLAPLALRSSVQDYAQQILNCYGA